MQECVGSFLLVLYTGISSGLDIRNAILQAASVRHGGVKFVGPEIFFTR